MVKILKEKIEKEKKLLYTQNYICCHSDRRVWCVGSRGIEGEVAEEEKRIREKRGNLSIGRI